MKMSSPLVFFGSGPVALKSLEALSTAFDIELVLTKPQPTHHKEAPPVVDWCKQHGQAFITTTNQANLNEVLANVDLKSKLGVVVDYGIIISQEVIDSFELGIINSHFSLLPLLRGADPISFAVLEGHKKTGVSLMKIVAELDEGPLLAQQELPLSSDMTTPVLTERLIETSNDMLIKYLPEYITGSIKPENQPSSTPPTYTRKLTKEDGRLDWSKDAPTLEREVRAFAGWPRSRTDIGSSSVVITKTRVLEQDGEPGKFFVEGTGELAVYCGKDALVIERLIPSGRKEMSGKDFLRGFSIN